jgi:hypothetical protein
MRTPEKLEAAAVALVAALAVAPGCSEKAHQPTMTPDAGHTLVVKNTETESAFSKAELADAFNKSLAARVVFDTVKAELRRQLGAPTGTAANDVGCFSLPEIGDCHPQDCTICATTLDNEGDLPRDDEFRDATEAIRRVAHGHVADEAKFFPIARRNAGQGDQVVCGRFPRVVSEDFDKCQLSPDQQRGVKPTADPTPFRVQEMMQGGQPHNVTFGPSTEPIRTVLPGQNVDPTPPNMPKSPVMGVPLNLDGRGIRAK